MAKLDESLQNKKQKAATALLRGELQKLDFARPVSSRVSRILGPVRRFSHCTESAPDETCVTCFSSWGALLGSYASSAMVFVQHEDFTLRGEEQVCRIGFPG